jgi:hypothetical protein
MQYNIWFANLNIFDQKNAPVGIVTIVMFDFNKFWKFLILSVGMEDGTVECVYTHGGSKVQYIEVIL